jgi:uncharacterized Zn-finger protein
MEAQVTALNISELCRICAACTSGLVRHCIFEDINIPQKIATCLPISVSEEDDLSKFICGECIYKLDLLYDFRDLSLKTEEYLKTLISASKLNYFKSDEEINTINEMSQLPCESDIIPVANLDNSVSCNEVKSSVNDLLVGDTLVEKCVDEVKQDQPIVYTRPIRAVRLASEISYNSDSILETLLKKKNSVRNKKKYAAKKKKTVLKQCKYCPLVLPSGKYGSHLVEEHKIEFECNECGNRFSCVEDLEEHQNLTNHSVESQEETKKRSKSLLQCNTCQKTYTRKHLLILHLRRHTGERPFPCHLCERKYACKSSLNSHLLKHKEEWKHVCNFCGKGFVDKHSFVYHVRSNHTGERPFVCDKCGKKFIKKQDLLKHEQAQHSEMPQKLFACEKCGRVCKDYDALRNHRRSHIPVETRRVHKCTLCEASFTGKTGLMKHMHRHTGEMPYECEQCAKRFFTKKGLELHLVIHSGVKSFVCEYCGRAFSQDNTLRVHRRTHTGERPYECNVCFKRFTQSSALNSHKKLHLKDN